MIDRPHIVSLLAAAVACAAGCSTSSNDSSSSVASASDAPPEAAMVVKADPNAADGQSWKAADSGGEKPMTFTADASAARNWSSAGGGDKPKMAFSTSDGAVVTGGKTPPMARTPPAGMGFTSVKPGSGDEEVMQDPDQEVPQLSEADQKRYNEVAIKLVKAINNEDRETYRTLFSDEGWEASISWWKEMLAPQTSRYGRIARAYAPRRGFMKFGGMAFRGDRGEREATIVVHFEEPFGAALTIALDEEGLIRKTNTFAKAELAFLDPGEDKIIFQLED